MTDNDRPEIARGVLRGDARTDTTQTFGHDIDLSFVPFGAELSQVELDAISALPSGSALMIGRSGPTAQPCGTI